MGKDNQAKHKPKKAGVAILIPVKIYFKEKPISRDKKIIKDHFIVIQVSIDLDG